MRSSWLVQIEMVVSVSCMRNTTSVVVNSYEAFQNNETVVKWWKVVLDQK